MALEAAAPPLRIPPPAADLAGVVDRVCDRAWRALARWPALPRTPERRARVRRAVADHLASTVFAVAPRRAAAAAAAWEERELLALELAGRVVCALTDGLPFRPELPGVARLLPAVVRASLPRGLILPPADAYELVEAWRAAA